ncbi:MAG: hypothetical protein A2868_02175 [Candidatus Levybacteria bacterium RIFCSPHIGHO2_01_FULL_40_15b]|nr:MAG: hypothetical protein A2868_02175 [Candidatus Levybacteria bacterium RIFCSPHIGHO2_01_FULL_40_15b]
MPNSELEPGRDPQRIPFSMRLRLVGALIKESVMHPLVTSRFTLDTENKRIITERGKFDEPTPSPKMQLKAVGLIFSESIFHPLTTSTIVYDMEQGKVYAVREARHKNK